MASEAGFEDRFQIVGEIGQGGFAHVYRARERASGQQVALKVLKDSFLGNEVVVERFRREVFAIASISSPHVVKMHDFGLTGHQVWLAMEYVEGKPLRDTLAERSFRADEVHLVVGQIALALAAAHRCNIVHRDLKPENVMLVPAGPDGGWQVKVLDFGLAKLAELERSLELEPLTRVGMCFGTPQYMAPELIQGAAPHPAVDLWALGVITYELLSNSLPWDGQDPMTVMMQVVRGALPRLRRSNGGAAGPRTAEVDRFLQKALSKDPKSRPPDAASFFRDFELALYGAARPARAGARPPKEDEVFKSVWAASFRLDDDVGDTTDVDASAGLMVTPSDLSGLSGLGPKRPRRLSASWQQSLNDLPIRNEKPPGPLELSVTDGDATVPFQPVDPVDLATAPDKVTDVMPRGVLGESGPNFLGPMLVTPSGPLPLGAPPVGATPERRIDDQPTPMTLVGGPSAAEPTLPGQGAGSAARAATRPKPSSKPARPAASGSFKPERTELIEGKRPKPASLFPWIMLVIGLIVVALVAGYWLGRTQ